MNGSLLIYLIMMGLEDVSHMHEDLASAVRMLLDRQ
jgi:hypothetical protein